MEEQQLNYEYVSKEDISHLLAEEAPPKEGDGWVVVYESERMNVWRKKTETGHYILKAIVDAEVSADTICYVLTDIEFRRSWDNGGRDMQVIEKIDDNLDIIRFWAKTPVGFTDREWVQSRLIHKDEEGVHYVLYRSTQHKDWPEDPKKFVRAYTTISGYLLRPVDENNTKVLFVSQNDVKGSIPGWVINMLAGYFLKKWFGALRDACLKHHAEQQQLKATKSKKKEEDGEGETKKVKKEKKNSEK
ncbi:hypothetical protein QOT17_002592 [Balamuthia mandrillaris]